MVSLPFQLPCENVTGFCNPVVAKMLTKQLDIVYQHQPLTSFTSLPEIQRSHSSTS